MHSGLVPRLPPTFPAGSVLLAILLSSGAAGENGLFINYIELAWLTVVPLSYLLA